MFPRKGGEKKSQRTLRSNILFTTRRLLQPRPEGNYCILFYFFGQLIQTLSVWTPSTPTYDFPLRLRFVFHGHRRRSALRLGVGHACCWTATLPLPSPLPPTLPETFPKQHCLVFIPTSPRTAGRKPRPHWFPRKLELDSDWPNQGGNWKVKTVRWRTGMSEKEAGLWQEAHVFTWRGSELNALGICLFFSTTETLFIGPYLLFKAT